MKVHPATGRPALYIGRHAYGIPGLSEAESEALLDELLTFACQPPRVYHHDWQVGDLVVWDNRCVLHRASPLEPRPAPGDEAHAGLGRPGHGRGGGVTTNGQGAPQAPWGNASRHDGALRHIRICDLSGQLAGAGATRVLAAFGAQVIRIEDPVTTGLWDIVRQIGPYINGDRSPDGGSGFNNHNVEKLGITLNLRTERGKELLAELVRVSNAVTENFAAGVMERLGFGYDRLRELRPDVVYVSNCGFGQTGPYRPFKSWGPIAQAVSGLTHTSGLPGQEPAGWGYSYMDHTGGYVMAIALLAALYHQRRTGEGQWVDLACIEAGIALTGPAVLDATVNGRDAARRRRRRTRTAARRRRWRRTASTRAATTTRGWPSPAATTTTGRALADVIGEPWAKDDALGDARRPARRPGRPRRRAGGVDRPARARRRRRRGARGRRAVRAGAPGRPSAATTTPRTTAWGLWPTVTHTKHGAVRVDGLPVHLSAHRLAASSGPARCSGEDNERVYAEVLGLTTAEIGRLADGRGDLMGPLDGVAGGRAVPRARRLGRQAARRPRRRRRRGRAARRLGPARATGRSSTTSPAPSAACGGGTTTRPSAASSPTSTADRERAAGPRRRRRRAHRGRGARRARRRRARLGGAVGRQPAAGDGVDHAVRRSRRRASHEPVDRPHA